ncbi:hypothetical protein [Rhizobium herbae]
MFSISIYLMIRTGGALPLFSSHVIEMCFYHSLSEGVNIDRHQIATRQLAYSGKHPGMIGVRKTEAMTLDQRKNQDILKGDAP